LKQIFSVLILTIANGSRSGCGCGCGCGCGSGQLDNGIGDIFECTAGIENCVYDGILMWIFE
jgi:hypothetical protein